MKVDPFEVPSKVPRMVNPPALVMLLVNEMSPEISTSTREIVPPPPSKLRIWLLVVNLVVPAFWRLTIPEPFNAIPPLNSKLCVIVLRLVSDPVTVTSPENKFKPLLLLSVNVPAIDDVPLAVKSFPAGSNVAPVPTVNVLFTTI